MSTNNRVVADIWLLTVSWTWYARWYEYEMFITSCTDSIYDLENEWWLFGDMIDHVGIYGSGWPRVCQPSTSVLYHITGTNVMIQFLIHFNCLYYTYITTEVFQFNLIIFPRLRCAYGLHCAHGMHHNKSNITNLLPVFKAKLKNLLVPIRILRNSNINL